MKNYDLYKLYEVLFTLSHKENIILPIKVGYVCLKNKNLLEPYYNAINDSRLRIIQKYAEQDENGDLRVPKNKIEEANKELQEVLDMEETDIKIQKININDIQESLPMDIITGLMPMLIEEEE